MYRRNVRGIGVFLRWVASHFFALRALLTSPRAELKHERVPRFCHAGLDPASRSVFEDWILASASMTKRECCYVVAAGGIILGESDPTLAL